MDELDDLIRAAPVEDFQVTTVDVTNNQPQETEPSVEPEGENPFDLMSLYGQPILNFDWLFERVSVENRNALARYNATALSVLDSSTYRPSRTNEFFKNEYSFLENVEPDLQNQYVRSRAAEITGFDFQRELDLLLSAARANIFSSDAPPIAGEEPPIEGQPAAEVSPLQQRVQEILANQQRLGEYTTSNQVLNGDGIISTMSAIAAYQNASDPTDKAAIETKWYDYLMFSTMEKLGHDPDLLTAEMIDDWLRVLVPGAFTYEVSRYGGTLSQIEFDNLPAEERMAYAADIAKNLQNANADPLIVLGTLDRFRPDRSLLSGPTATTIFTALDLLAVGVVAKYGLLVPRWLEKIAILRKMKTAPGAAALLGNNRVAGTLNATALLGDDAQRLALGVERVTAGMNASPFRFSSLDSQVVDGISADTIRFIDEERQVLNYKLNQAVNPETTASAGFLRESERAAANTAILSRFPSTAEVIESTPFGVRIRVVTANNEKFTTPEELAQAERRYDVWRESYEAAVRELDVFYSQIGQFDVDASWVNRLEANKNAAKLEMEEAYRVLTRGIEPDKIEESTVFYTRSMLDGTFDGVLEGGRLVPDLASPSTIFSNLDSLVVSERTAILAQQSTLNNLYRKLMSDALATLSSKQARNVDAVLLHGDDLGVRFTAAELTRGIDVPGLGTVRLNKRQLASYYKARDVFDAMHGVYNVAKYRRFKFENYRMTNILIDDGAETLGAPRKFYVRDAVVTSTARDGSTTVRLPSVNEILDARGTGPATAVKFSGGFRDDVTKAVREGKAWVVQFEKPVRIGDNLYNYSIIRPSKLKELDMNIIPYRTGYVPRIYESVPYVVRQQRSVKIDGVVASKPAYTTERFFMSRTEGEAWAATKTQEDGILRVTDTDVNWRTSDKAYVEEINDSVRSGLYETERGEAIPFGTLGEEAARSSAFAAMDRYLGNLAYTLPLNEWRQGVIQRYFNSVNKYLVSENDFVHLITKEGTFKPGTPENVIEAIQTTGKYLQEQIGVTGTGERAFARLAQSVADNMENSLFWKGVSKVAPSLPDKVKLKLLYGADNVNAYGWIRNSAFRVYLGFFSMPQLYVQASNMVTVASLHPLNAPSVIRRILSLRSVASLSFSNPDYERIVSIAARAALMKYDDFEPIVRSWIKSGLYYSTRINADAAMASRGISPGGDLSRVAKFADQALLFPYQEGELWARMYAYIDSAIRARKAGIEITSTDGVRAVTDEAFKVAFNYTQANRAKWQTGAWSIPTQFLQAPVKFWEAMLAPTKGKYKGQFTKMQRLRLALGQIVLFGAAGIPMGGFVRDQITNWLTTPGEDGSALHPNLSKEELEFINGGVADLTASLIASAITDTDVSIAVAERTSLGGGLNLTFANLTAEDADFPKIILGAAGGVLLQRTMPALEHVARAHGTQVAAGTFTPERVLEVADKLGTITSSWNAIHRARLWYNSNAMVTRYGDVLMPLDREEDYGIILMKGLGFRSYEEIANYRIRDFNEESNPQKEIRDALKSAQATLNEYITEGYLTNEGKDTYSQELYMIRESLPDEGSKLEFDKQWSAALVESDSMAAKEYRKLIDRLMIYDKDTLGAVPADFGVIQDNVIEQVIQGQ